MVCAARQSWVSSRSSGSSFESAYGTHAWVDALCHPAELDALPAGLQAQRQAAIDSLRASMDQGMARGDLAPVRTSTSSAASPPLQALAVMNAATSGRCSGTVNGRQPLAGLDALVNAQDRSPTHKAAATPLLRWAVDGHKNELSGAYKVPELPAKPYPISRQALGRLSVPASIPESQVAPLSAASSRTSFPNPFGPDVDTLADAQVGTPPRKAPSRVRPSMEARRKRLDLSALQVSLALSVHQQTSAYSN